jgi:hypothetical protein
MRAPWAVVLLPLWACQFRPSGAADDGVGIDAGSEPVCTPGCAGDVLCEGGAQTTCELGCSEAPSPHCREFHPSNQVDVTDAGRARQAVTARVGRLLVMNTDDGSIVSESLSTQGPPTVVRAAGFGEVDGVWFATRAQSGASVEVATWSAAGLVVEAGALLQFRGRRAAIVVSAGVTTIDGVVDASGGRRLDGTACTSCGGVGGGDGGTASSNAGGCAPGGPGAYSFGSAWETGGGGGGMGTVGARGGASNSDQTPGGPVASITGCPGEALEPLAGGSGGGRGATNGTEGRFPGGGGGGALQLVSLRPLRVGPSGVVYAGGTGGSGSMGAWGGGGGGSGGALLIEAPTIELASGASLAATGGGGGAGREPNAGSAGRTNGTRAPGGAPSGGNCAGGAGGIGVDGADETVPVAGTGGADGTGGGGGAAGRIRLNVAEGVVVSTAGAIIAPAPTFGVSVR